MSASAQLRQKIGGFIAAVATVLTVMVVGSLPFTGNGSTGIALVGLAAVGIGGLVVAATPSGGGGGSSRPALLPGRR